VWKRYLFANLVTIMGLLMNIIMWIYIIHNSDVVTSYDVVTSHAKE